MGGHEKITHHNRSNLDYILTIISLKSNSLLQFLVHKSCNLLRGGGVDQKITFHHNGGGKD